MSSRFAQCAIGRQQVRTVGFEAGQVRETAEHGRNIATGGLPLHRDRNGITVVLDQKQHRQALQTSRIDSFPELALTGGAFSAGNQRDGVRSGFK